MAKQISSDFLSILEKKNKNYTELLLNNLQEIVFILNKERKIEYVNKIWEFLLGFKEGSVIREDFLRFVSEDDRNKLLVFFESSQKHFLFTDVVIESNIKVKKVFNLELREFYDDDNSMCFYFGTLSDITQRKVVYKKLEDLNKLHNIINILSSKLVRTDAKSLNRAINYGLKELGEYAKVDRVYIFDFEQTKKVMNNSFEWCAEGITPQIDILQDIPFDLIPSWFDAFERNEHIYIPRVDELSADRSVERDILEPQGIISLLTIPMFYEN